MELFPYLFPGSGPEHPQRSIVKGWSSLGYPEIILQSKQWSDVLEDHTVQVNRDNNISELLGPFTEQLQPTIAIGHSFFGLYDWFIPDRIEFAVYVLRIISNADQTMRNLNMLLQHSLQSIDVLIGVAAFPSTYWRPEPAYES